MKVYAPASGKTVVLGVADDTDTSSLDVASMHRQRKANTWETLTFDFSNPNGSGTVDHANNYNQAKVAFGIFENTEDTYYFDEIEFSAISSGDALALDAMDRHSV